MTWLVAGVFFALICWIALWPLIGGASGIMSAIPNRRPSRRKILREEKASLLLALRELDFDYETAKLSAGDYKGLRAKYETDAVGVLKELDRLEEDWKRIQLTIDRELSRRLGFAPFVSSRPAEKTATPKSKGGDNCPKCGAEVTANSRFCGSCGGQLGSVCGHCGRSMKPGDTFCGACGAKLQAAAHA